VSQIRLIIVHSLHWFLAIICNPEYVLQPPPPAPPKAISSVQTRKRKRNSKNEDLVELSDTSDPPEAPPESASIRDPTSMRSRSIDEADETRVEAMLDLGGIAISPPEETQAEPPEKNAALLDELTYPPSDPGMDVDAPQEDTPEPSVRSGSEREISPELTVNTRPPEDGDIVGADEKDIEMDAVGEPSTSAIPTSRFYSTISSKGKERAMSPAVPHPSELEIEKEESVDTDPTDFDSNRYTPVPLHSLLALTVSYRAYIFTFDSLGGRHPGAIAHLSTYLQMEALDKKGIDPSNTTPPIGKHALVSVLKSFSLTSLTSPQVPAQPNFCDCGVYLIHFVQAFMRQPRRASEIILSKKPKDYSSYEREQDWDAAAVTGFRDELRARAESLADQWRQERAAREEHRRREREKEAASAAALSAMPEAVEDSDDDIIVGEVVTKTKAAPAKGKGKAKATPALEQSKADRLR
jgi:hypothetical protein